jgi:hypothetical protein
MTDAAMTAELMRLVIEYVAQRDALLGNLRNMEKTFEDERNRLEQERDHAWETCFATADEWREKFEHACEENAVLRARTKELERLAKIGPVPIASTTDGWFLEVGRSLKSVEADSSQCKAAVARLIERSEKCEAFVAKWTPMLMRFFVSPGALL